MPADQVVIDANLLVLLVVGAIDRRLVGKHRRVKNFTLKDYDLLLDRLQETPHPVVVTPNTLTEVSNLIEDRQDRRFLRQLKEFIEVSEEVVVASSVASNNRAYEQLGLSDAVILELVSVNRLLSTTDDALCQAVMTTKGSEAVIRF